MCVGVVEEEEDLFLIGISVQVLNWVRDQAEKESDLQQYVPHLQSNTILRLLQQVGPLPPPPLYLRHPLPAAPLPVGRQELTRHVTLQEVSG